MYFAESVKSEERITPAHHRKFPFFPTITMPPHSRAEGWPLRPREFPREKVIRDKRLAALVGFGACKIWHALHVSDACVSSLDEWRTSLQQFVCFTTPF
jgi:hypothetical protein